MIFYGNNEGLAGGVAMNCVMNGKLAEQDFCDDIYIQPAASDNGVSYIASDLSLETGNNSVQVICKERGKIGNLTGAPLNLKTTHENIKTEAKAVKITGGTDKETKEEKESISEIWLLSINILENMTTHWKHTKKHYR